MNEWRRSKGGFVVNSKQPPLPAGAASATSPEEKQVGEYLAEAWNAFLRLEPTHPCHREEFMRAIHAAQCILMWRVAQRADPDTWPRKS